MDNSNCLLRKYMYDVFITSCNHTTFRWRPARNLNLLYCRSRGKKNLEAKDNLGICHWHQVQLKDSNLWTSSWEGGEVAREIWEEVLQGTDSIRKNLINKKLARFVNLVSLDIFNFSNIQILNKMKMLPESHVSQASSSMVPGMKFFKEKLRFLWNNLGEINRWQMPHCVHTDTNAMSHLEALKGWKWNLAMFYSLVLIQIQILKSDDLFKKQMP